MAPQLKRVKSKFLGISEKVICYLAAACYLAHAPYTSLYTSTHTALMHTHCTYMPKATYICLCTPFCVYPSVFWLDLVIPHLVLAYFPDHSLGLHCLDAVSLFLSSLCNPPFSCVTRDNPKQNYKVGKFFFYKKKESLRQFLITGTHPNPPLYLILSRSTALGHLLIIYWIK